MFKWCCFLVAVVFLGVAGWMLNDIRLEIRRVGETARNTGDAVNQHLPTIVEKSKQTTEVVAEHLPEVVAKVKTTTDTVAALAEDIRQVRQLLGLDSKVKRDETLVGYANGVL